MRKALDQKAVSAPSPRGPHQDELIRHIRAALARAVLRPSGRGVRASVAAAALAAPLIAWGLSGIYEVDADETGMVTRLGAFEGETGPGLHYHLPAPFETVRRLSVGTPNRLELGEGGQAPGPMLTRDGQLADVTFSVSWRIADPYKYLFGSAEPDTELRRGAEAAMREAVSQATFADMTTAAREGVSAKAASVLQAMLRREDFGVSAQNVEIRDVEPPEGAQGGFHDVAAAREDARNAVGDVGAYRDRALAAARADAAKSIQASQSARDQEISEAGGEADRFAVIDAQYRKAPDVTRERLYTEMMERVLHNTNKVIVQMPKGAGGQIVLPPDVFRTKTGTTPSQGGSAQGQPQGSAGQTPPQAAAEVQQGPSA